MQQVQEKQGASMIHRLIKIANILDSKEMYDEANIIDSLLYKYAHDIPDFSSEKFEESREKGPAYHPSFDLYGYIRRGVDSYMEQWPDNKDDISAIFSEIEGRLGTGPGWGKHE